MENNTILSISHLAKTFGGICAVQDFTGKVDEQQIVGIIGPNGAGENHHSEFDLRYLCTDLRLSPV